MKMLLFYPSVFVVVVLLTVVACLVEPEKPDGNTVETYISNGAVLDLDDYPYVVGIAMRSCIWLSTRTCTGTIVSPVYVLTAAHCTDGVRVTDIKVMRGNPLMRTLFGKVPYRKVVQVIPHHNYGPRGTVTADISLLRLRLPFDNVRAFSSLQGTMDKFQNDKVVNCTIVGFGQTEKQKLPTEIGYKADVLARYGPDVCKDWSDPNSWEYYICAKPGKKMICKGDSGGPLICGRHQYGVASHMFSTHPDVKLKCGNPAVHTRHISVYMYKDWIDDRVTGSRADSLLPNRLTLVAVGLTASILLF